MTTTNSFESSLNVLAFQNDEYIFCAYILHMQ